MLLRLTFQVPPRGKQTARTTFQRGKPQTYTPAETAGLQEQLRAETIGQLNRQGLPKPLIPAPSPVFLLTTYYLHRPTKGRYSKLAFPTKTPDLSNMTKLVEDSLNGVLWTDDAQVVQNLERKVWAAEVPLIEVIVADIDELDTLYPSVDELATRRRSRQSAPGSASSRGSLVSTPTTSLPGVLVVGTSWPTSVL